MGDAPPLSSEDSMNPSQGYDQSGSTTEPQSTSYHGHPSYSQTGFQTQQQLHAQYGAPQNAFSSQLDMAQTSPAGRGTPYNVSNMANTLPQAGYRPGSYSPGNQQQRFNSGATAVPELAQFAGQAGIPIPNQKFFMPQHPQVQQYYHAQQFVSPQQNGAMQARQGVPYYQNQVVGHHPRQQLHPSYYYSANQFPAQTHGLPTSMIGGHYGQAQGIYRDHQVTSRTTEHGGMPYSPGQKQRNESGDERQNVVRGPPRKPKQSGHAIWIGNLPLQADLMSLVHHVCKETPGLESLFLISKSNCAFANFSDEATCSAAQSKLHGSKFKSVRLMSRLRGSTVEGASGITAPTGPAATTASSTTPRDLSTQNTDSTSENTSPVATQTEESGRLSGQGAPQRDKFFILKSLTVEDLELSVQTGIWATQSHNEETLNAAFKNADNVYLVFSANKSGEYFGYARMTSQMNEDPAAAIEFAPKVHSADDTDLLKVIPTEATEFASKGRIIDDSARGTIFWEAEPGGTEDGEEEESDIGKSSDVDGEAGPSKAWGKPFKLEWLSATGLPFYRTRGLRNPWNSNREVKIARDGTELEPSAGRRLIGLFNRVQSPGPMHTGARPGVPMIVGYPPLRPY